jgi:uncharacterized protein HemX
MQPNPLSPSQEEKKPESEVQMPNPAPTSVQPTPAPVLVQPVARPVPAPVQAKKPTRWGNIAAVVLGLGMVFLLIVAAGLGFWAYNLNTQLTTTQQELATLQGDYGKLKAEHANLQSENEKVSASLTQTKTDLEKANGDLATAQDSLKTAQGQYTDLTAKVDKVAKYADVLNTLVKMDQSGLLKIESKIEAANDSGLNAVWNKFKNSPSGDTMSDVLVYLTSAIEDNLK